MQAHSAIAPLMPPLLNLPAAQKLELIEELWCSLTQSDLDRPVPAWKLEILDQSKAQYQSEPESAQTWETLRQETQSTRRQS